MERVKGVSNEKPYVKFHGRDWLGDPLLRMVKHDVRGVWIDLLCAMMESEPYGCLAVNGRPMTDDEAARLVGIDADAYRAYLAQIESAGIASRNDAGMLYSRRLVRDYEAFTQASEWGKGGGGNPRLKKKNPKAIDQKPEAKGAIKEGESESIKGDAEPEPPVTQSDFDRFWTAYPRKTGKKAAEKSWEKAIDKPDIEAVLASIERQRASQDWTKDGGQFIPHPATWLNQGRWADEPVMPSNRVPVAAIPDYSEEFDAFFGLYPAAGRVEKAEAWRAWQEVLPSIQQAAQGDMKAWLTKVIGKLRAQEKTPRWTEQGGKYIPKPANYLRNGGWEE